MYAVFKTGGKQYKAQPGDVLKVEKLPQALGSEFDVTDVLLIGGEKTFVGQPQVENAKVTVVVTKQDRGPKMIIFKKRRRQGYRRLKGHRQLFTELFVKSITSPEGQTMEAEGKPQVADPEKKKAKMEKTAEAAKARKEAKRKGLDSASVTKKKAKKKASGKKKTKKKAVKKKTAKTGKKKAAKKTTAKKKTAKKAKKATKKS